MTLPACGPDSTGVAYGVRTLILLIRSRSAGRSNFTFSHPHADCRCQRPTFYHCATPPTLLLSIHYCDCVRLHSSFIPTQMTPTQKLKMTYK